MKKIELAPLLDRLLADSILQSEDGNLLFRSRITAAVTVMYCFSMAFVATLLSTFTILGVIDVWSAAYACITSSLFYIGQMLYFKRSGNLFIASGITIGIMFCAANGFVAITGGWQSSVIIFLFVVPMCAFLMSGSLSGIIWSCHGGHFLYGLFCSRIQRRADAQSDCRTICLFNGVFCLGFLLGHGGWWRNAVYRYCKWP